MNKLQIEKEEASVNRTHVKLFAINRNLTSSNFEFTKTIPIQNYTGSSKWSDWIFDDNKDQESYYVDLLKMPEVFTAYDQSNIWNEIVYGNILRMDFPQPGAHERLMNRLVSGLLASCNTHVSMFYLNNIENKNVIKEGFEALFYVNHTEFYNSVGKHPDRVRNLFYLYMFLIHTIDQIQPFVPKYMYNSTSSKENKEIQSKMLWLGHYINGLQDPEYIASDLFRYMGMKEIRQIIKPQFRNMTQLFECIA